MDIEDFIERVRIGVVSGVFTVKDAVQYMTDRNWSTTRDVPADRRETMLKDLTK